MRPKDWMVKCTSRHHGTCTRLDQPTGARYHTRVVEMDGDGRENGADGLMAPDQGHDWRAAVGARSYSGRSVDLVRAGEAGRGRQANTPEQIPPRGWRDILWRVLWSISADRVLSTSGSVAFFSLLAVFPGIAAIVSLYGLFADASTIGKHLSLLSGFLPGGVLQLIAEQITLISRQGNETLGTAFIVGVLIALGSANSGIAALFDALNVVYDEREKRSMVQFYATTFLFTLAGIIFVVLAIAGVVVLPLILKFVGLATTTEWLLAILRWPLLFVTIVVSLAASTVMGRAGGALAGDGSPGAASLGRCYGWQPQCCSLFMSPHSTATTRHTARLELESASWSGCGSQQ